MSKKPRKMNNLGDVDHQLITFIKLGLAEQVSCSPALADVPMDSRLIDYQLLRLAVQCNQTRIVQLLLDRGFRVNPDRSKYKIADTLTHCRVDCWNGGTDATVYKMSDTPLHCAVECWNGEMLRLLLTHNASVEHKNEHGLTALQTAVKLGNFAAVDTIMRELESRDYLRRLSMWLHAACLRGNVVYVKRALECGISIKEPVPLSSPIWPGCTNLHLAVVSRSVELMELLIARGIDTKVKDIMNLTALQLAAKTGDKLLLRQLLRLYVDYEVDLAVEHTDGMTYLHHACTLDQNSLDIVRAFLKRGVNVHATTSLALSDAPGYTALHFAVKHGNFDNVQELMKYGADPTVKNGHGETPLHLTGVYPEIVTACFNNYQFYDVDTRDRYGTSHFHIACLYAEHEIVSEFLNRGCVLDINARIQLTPALIPYHGSTPLHLAVRRSVLRVNDDRQDIVVRKLLESPRIDVNARDSYGLTALHIAVLTTNKDRSVEALIHDNRTDVNARNLDGQTALHLAVKRGDIMSAQIRALLRYDADVYKQDERGRTPVHVADESVLKILLPTIYPQKMLRENPCDANGISIFDIACHNYKLSEARGIVEWFLQEGLVSDETAVHGLSRVTLMTMTTLHGAVQSRCTRTVMLLLRFGLANVKMSDAKGATALHVVAKIPEILAPANNELAIARILVDAGADIEATTLYNGKRTALHRAAKYNFIDIIEFLIKSGANVSARDAWQNTPLHLAAESCNVEVVQMLIDAGADVNACNESGALPLHKVSGKVPNRYKRHLSFRRRHLDVSKDRYSKLIDVLLYAPTSHGNIDAMDKTGMTPLCIAFKIDNPDCTRAFLEHGADPEPIYHRMLEHGNQRTFDWTTQMIAKRMIPLQVAGLLKDKKLVNLPWDFEMEMEDDLDDAPTMGSLEEDSRKELTRMAEVFVDPYTTLRDLLYKSDIALSPHLTNDHLRKMLVVGVSVEQQKQLLPLFLREYPNYGLRLRSNYTRALSRLELVQEATKALEVIGIHMIPEESATKVLPEPCIEAILGMVNDVDLRNLVEAVYHKKIVLSGRGSDLRVTDFPTTSRGFR